MAKWKLSDIPNQKGRTAIVTGANSGIGFETARVLACNGADVILACRSKLKGEEAVSKIKEENPKGSVSLEILDLSDLASVRLFADKMNDKLDCLDLLILNAGVMVPPYTKTTQGYELQFGVNHLGHFALTGLLHKKILSTEGSRIISVSSIAASFGKMHWDDLLFENKYLPWRAYGQSKLANQLFIQELQRRLEAVRSGTIVANAHPGWSRTHLQRTSKFTSLGNILFYPFNMAPIGGAMPTLRAAVDSSVVNGSYYGPRGLGKMRGAPKLQKIAKRATNRDDAKRLWEESIKLTGVNYLNG